jgi:hypothetical protein
MLNLSCTKLSAALHVALSVLLSATLKMIVISVSLCYAVKNRPETDFSSEIWELLSSFQFEEGENRVEQCGRRGRPGHLCEALGLSRRVS